MRELGIFRYAYAARGSARRPAWHAHRAMRTAVAVGSALGILMPFDTEGAIHRIEAAHDEHEIALEDLDYEARQAAPPFVIPREEVPILRDTAKCVHEALSEAVDRSGHPRGRLGEEILYGIDRGLETPFQRQADGTVRLEHPRLTINDLLDVLRHVVLVLDDAIDKGLDVEMIPDEGWHPSYYEEEP